MKRNFLPGAVTLLMGLWAWLIVGWPGAGWLTAVAGLLVALADEDYRTGFLPDALTLTLLVAGIALPWLWGWPVLPHLWGALAGGGLGLAVVGISFGLLGKPGWGGGDVKLLAALGAWVGAAGLLPLILLASCSAVVFLYGYQLSKGKRLRKIPFGPFLVAGGWLTLLYQPVFWGLILGLA